MKIERIDFDEPAVVVLGAGATRGASFVEDLRGADLASVEDLPDNVEVVPPEFLAFRVIDAGLTTWLAGKLA